MSNPPAPARIPLPRLASVAYILGIPLVLFGGFLNRVQSRYITDGKSNFDWAQNQYIAGTVMLWAGALLLVVALVLTGVRAIAESHLRASQSGQRL